MIKYIIIHPNELKTCPHKKNLNVFNIWIFEAALFIIVKTHKNNYVCQQMNVYKDYGISIQRNVIQEWKKTNYQVTKDTENP